MKFAVYTHVNHTFQNHEVYGYGPYIREMNIWLRHVDRVEIVGPVTKRPVTPLDLAYEHSDLTFTEIPLFNVTRPGEMLKTVFRLPLLFWVIFNSMRKADHLHLRCPGNVGLIACLVQILFPNKKKTAKYAGNWDLKAKQPWSYRIQKWILNNPRLTKNMQVLVYGAWENSSINIKPFFTATYRKADIKETKVRSLSLGEDGGARNPIHFIFAGTLSEGKRPLYAVKLIEALKEKGYQVKLDIYGEGIQRTALENYLKERGLAQEVTLFGNQGAEIVLQAYQKGHFLLLPSKSEGWPKVVAEAMFWGTVPVSTRVSCVPYMLGEGSRGLLLTLEVSADSANLDEILKDANRYESMAANGMEWSRKYTLDYFEEEIKKMLLQ